MVYWKQHIQQTLKIINSLLVKYECNLPHKPDAGVYWIEQAELQQKPRSLPLILNEHNWLQCKWPVSAKDIQSAEVYTVQHSAVHISERTVL